MKGLWTRLVTLIRPNFPLKVASVVGSMCLFYLIRTGGVREVTRLTRVRILTSADMTLVGPQERTVEVTVRIPDALFSQVPAEDELRAEVDMRQEPPGKFKTRLSRENFPGLDRRYFVIVHDPWLEIELDAKATKSVPVRAVLGPGPALGVRVAVTPREIEITGAEKELRKTTEVVTAPIALDLTGGDFAIRSQVEASGASSLQLSQTQVVVQVQRNLATRILEHLPLQVEGGMGKGATPNAATVVLEGLEGDLAEATAEVWIARGSGGPPQVRVHPASVRVLAVSPRVVHWDEKD